MTDKNVKQQVRDCEVSANLTGKEVVVMSLANSDKNGNQVGHAGKIGNQ